VEIFARQVATTVNREYLPALAKIRDTFEQKSLKNRLQKEDNVKQGLRQKGSQTI
jgi:hypothetical protein